MKHTRALFLLLLTPTLLMAANPKYKKPLQGLYLKAGVGDTIAQFDTTQTYGVSLLANNPANNQTYNIDANHQSQGTQFSGLIGIGYLYQIDALWVISGEFTANFTNAEAAYKNDLYFFAKAYDLTSRSTFNYTNDFAILIKPGLAIQQQTQFYALLGARWGNFKTTTEDTSSIELIDAHASAGLSNSSSAYELGFTVGVGVERLITKNWGVALEYAYTAYSKFPSVNGSFAFDPGVNQYYYASANESVSGSAAVNTIMLEITHRFW